MRAWFVRIVILTALLLGWGIYHVPFLVWLLVIYLPIVAVGFADILQRKQTIRRNFPIIGHFRYILEEVRPEIQQYFIENNADGTPFSRELRSIVYQRAKKALDTLPFGTQKNVYEIGYEWANHSLAPAKVVPGSMRVTVGGPHCKQPYSASIFNISAMSYGALSKNAILALNGGAKIGGFSHNTGEGGLSPYHLEPGGDLVWQIGTGYFSARTPDGRFDPEKFKDRAAAPSVKMIEIKLSQGAKPSHGGILPAAKVTKEISLIRDVHMGRDVISPPAHTAFDSPVGLLEFVAKLRDLSGGKPIGFKLCIGKRREFISICKAMVATGITPDFITIDGGEGGTGAAPLEFSNNIGAPLREGLVFAHNCLVGFDVRKDIRLNCSGRNVTGFDLITRYALGADLCNSARGMMMALGCIQALRCNSNKCPTGVATQNPWLVGGLDVTEKRVRVANFHSETLHSLAELLGAMGLEHPGQVRPWHVMKRTGLSEVRHFGEIYEFIPKGSLLTEGHVPKSFTRAWQACAADSWTSLSRD